MMNDAWSEARKRTAPAISSGSATRESGVASIIAFVASSGRTSVSAVFTYPGATTFARMLRDPSSRAMGGEFFRDFVRDCRPDVGFAALKDVRTKEKADSMQSFVFAETLKYYYLLFSPKSALDFDARTFNTEAHPLRRTW